MARIYKTKRLALLELKRRRKKGDLKSNIYQLDTHIFFIGTREQALREIKRRKI